MITTSTFPGEGRLRAEVKRPVRVAQAHLA
jgi:hypothetical protein